MDAELRGHLTTENGSANVADTVPIDCNQTAPANRSGALRRTRA